MFDKTVMNKMNHRVSIQDNCDVNLLFGWSELRVCRLAIVALISIFTVHKRNCITRYT